MGQLPTPTTCLILGSSQSTTPNDIQIQSAVFQEYHGQPDRQKHSWFDMFLGMMTFLKDILWCCWLGGRKGIQPVKNWVVGCWRGCLGWGADLHAYSPVDATASLPLTVSCSSKSWLVLTFLFYLSGTCSPGWSRTYSRRAVKRLCVCVCNWRHCETMNYDQ